MEDVKIKLVALWIFLAVGTLAAPFVFAIWMPGVIEQMMAGEVYGEVLSEGLVAISAFFLLIPMIMALLPLYLKDSANRWANIIIGMVFVFFGILGVIDSMGSIPALIIMEFPKLVVAALIVWHAWKWPKQEA
jgi:hypothetical protein